MTHLSCVINEWRSKPSLPWFPFVKSLGPCTGGAARKAPDATAAAAAAASWMACGPSAMPEDSQTAGQPGSSISIPVERVRACVLRVGNAGAQTAFASGLVSRL